MRGHNYREDRKTRVFVKIYKGDCVFGCFVLFLQREALIRSIRIGRRQKHKCVTPSCRIVTL